MASFARGLTSGFETGLRFGQAMREREKFEREEQQRRDLAAAYGLTPEQQMAPVATPEQVQRALAETQALQAQDVAEFGLTPEDTQQYAPQMPVEGQRVAMPTYTLGGQTFTRQPTQYDIDVARGRAAADVYGRFGDTARREEILRGLRQEERAMSAEQRAAAAEQRARAGEERTVREFGLRIGEAEDTAARDKKLRDDVAAWRNTKFETPAARDAALVDIYFARDPVKGYELLAKQQSAESSAIQLAGQRREQQQRVDLDAGFARIAGTNFINPEDKTKAILDLVERVQGPTEAAKLRATYTSQQLNDITLQAAQFDQKFTEAFRKGPDAVIAFVDEINPGFRLERDPRNPFNIIQINEDGTRSTFITAKDNNDLMRQLEGRRSPAAFVALSKEQFDRDTKRQDLQMRKAYYDRLAADSEAKTPEAKLAAIKKALGRDLTEEEKLIAVGLQVKGREERVAPTAAELNTANDMVGRTVMTPDGKPRLDADGKPQKHTLNTALQEVLNATRGKDKEGGLPGWGGGQTPPASATPAAAPTGLTTRSAAQPAATAEDTRRYTRERVRGGWDYTYNPRGKTKAEWAEIDRAND